LQAARTVGSFSNHRRTIGLKVFRMELLLFANLS
jgi:hypothetical protein